MAGTPTSGGPVELAIEQRLREALTPVELRVINESFMHSVPPGSESHFKVLVVSTEFDGTGTLARHRKVNGLLKEQFDGGLHALSVEALTPTQWAERGESMRASPPCRGGSKED